MPDGPRPRSFRTARSAERAIRLRRFPSSAAPPNVDIHQTFPAALRERRSVGRERSFAARREGPLFVVAASKGCLILHYVVTNRFTVSMKAVFSSMKGM